MIMKLFGFYQKVFSDLIIKEMAKNQTKVFRKINKPQTKIKIPKDFFE